MFEFLVFHFVQSQYDDEETTTISFSTSTNDINENLVESSPSTNNLFKTENETNSNPIESNRSSKQRIIIALAVLCAALAVLLAFFVSIVVCRWLQQDEDDDDYFSQRNNKTSQNFVGSTYNYRDQTYQQTVKL